MSLRYNPIDELKIRIVPSRAENSKKIFIDFELKGELDLEQLKDQFFVKNFEEHFIQLINEVKKWNDLKESENAAKNE